MSLYTGNSDNLSDALEGRFTLVPMQTAVHFALSRRESGYISASTIRFTNSYEDMFCIHVPPHSLGSKCKLLSAAWKKH